MTGESPGGWPVRAAILMNHPVQHFVAGLRLLAQHAELRPRVFYWCAATNGVYDQGFGRHVRWGIDLHSGYDWYAPAEGSTVGKSIRLWGGLSAYRPQVVLSFGWASPAARLGIAYAVATGTPLLLLGDSNLRACAGGMRGLLRRAVLCALFGRATGALATGSFNRDYYLSHGMPAARIRPGVYPTNVDDFTAASERRPHTPGDRLVIAFAGKLTPIKAPGDLLAAVARLDRKRPWEVRLIGDGPLRAQLEAAVERHRLGDRVTFFGFRDTAELPALFREVDVMVMPSHREPRGLVPIEAMAAGAAVVVSSATGVWGPGDAVRHGESGLVYPAGDIDALTSCLRTLLDDHRLRQRLARAGQERSRSFGPHGFATTVAAAVASVARGGVHARHH